MAMADTPVMRQYQAAKAANAGAMVMFRMGDFYELFGDDAVSAADILNITLTKRRTSKESDDGIPMCGVPYHAAESYIAKLLEAGHKVAVCEQTETPEEAKKARGSNALVNREVVRLYTAGTLTEDAYLNANASVYLVAVAEAGKPVTKARIPNGDLKGFEGIPSDLSGAEAAKSGTGGEPRGTDGSPSENWRGAVAWMDLSGGEVGVRHVNGSSLHAALAGLNVGEIVASESVAGHQLHHLPRKLVSVQSHLFEDTRAAAAITRAYGVPDAEGLGIPDAVTRSALGALIGYAELTQVGKLPVLKNPRYVSERSVLTIDAGTRKNLELTESLQGKRADSLLGAIDKTATHAGARLLSRWLAEPLATLSAITARQAAWGVLVNDTLRRDVRTRLKDTGDIARAVSRLLLGRGSPRDLAVLRLTGLQLPALREVLGKTGDGLLTGYANQLRGLDDLTALLGRALNDDDALPALVRDGGFIKDGFDVELDNIRRLVNHGNDLLMELERAEVSACGIDGLKLRYNKVWGYYIELTKAQIASVGGALPSHFIHRQTTTNSQRFTTDKLLTLERELAQAGANSLRREQELFAELVGAVRAASYPLLDAAEALACLDALQSAAEMASARRWVKPDVTDDCAFDVKAGRHPVVSERVGTFVPNDCRLEDGDAFWVLTGPNMAGKSTFLRQNALMVILAQMGWPVPAASARIGIADQLFSRIGAGDNLAAGQSTFMVEMVETAAILNRATRRSVVVLDEIGRGTATYDGLAIAWACVEDLAGRVGCRTIFATHYHELTSLAGQLPNVAVHHVAVREWKGEIVFLHEVKAGAASGNYGVHVARLAGVPSPVVKRADGILAALLKSARQDGVAKVGDLSLFAAPAAEEVRESEIERRLKTLDVDGLSAREALDELYRLRNMIG